MIQNLLWEAEENEQKTYRDGLGIQFFQCWGALVHGGSWNLWSFSEDLRHSKEEREDIYWVLSSIRHNVQGFHTTSCFIGLTEL